MAKPIYVLLSDENVRDYISNHLDLIDDDGSMSDEEVDEMVERIVERSTNGRLQSMLVAAFMDDWYFDKLLDVVDDCMYDFVSEVVMDKE